MIITKENYDLRNDEKFGLHNNKYVQRRFINPGEIRYAKLGLNIGFEENGKKDFRRPVLVVRRILSQVRMIDKRRFVHRIGKVSEEEMISIEKLLKELYLPRA